MSDTELSHCEQFLVGSMLTNELNSASSEKSSQSNLSFVCLILQEKKNHKIMQIFNGDHGFN